MDHTILERTEIVDTGYKTPCVLWTGSLSERGYGFYFEDNKQYYAHRKVYEYFEGDIPETEPRTVLDHLCRVHRCVAVDHLEPVTDRENVLRGESFAAVNATKTHCHRGHPFSPENTRIEKGSRVCRECKRISNRKHDAKRRPRKSL